jgi:hypothetical protein
VAIRSYIRATLTIVGIAILPTGRFGFFCPLGLCFDETAARNTSAQAMFSGSKFVFVGDFGQELKQLRNAVTSHGGSLAYVISKEVR